MDVIQVSYLYSLSEFYALVCLTGGTEIPFFPQEHALYAEGIKALETDLLVSCRADTAAVDKISAFLAQTVGKSEQCVIVRDGEHYIGLFFSPTASIVLQRRGQRWIVTPFQYLEESIECLLQNLSEYTAQAEICMKTGNGTWTRHYPADDTAQDVIRTAIDRMLDQDQKNGKDAELWRP